MRSTTKHKICRVSVELLLLTACLLAVWRGGGCLIVQAAPKLLVSCSAKNYPEVIVHKREDGGGYLEEIDDWTVHCAISQDGKTVWERDLPLAHPTGYEEAMSAIDKFRKQANQILKEKKK